MGPSCGDPLDPPQGFPMTCNIPPGIRYYDASPKHSFMGPLRPKARARAQGLGPGPGPRVGPGPGVRAQAPTLQGPKPRVFDWSLLGPVGFGISPPGPRAAQPHGMGWSQQKRAACTYIKECSPHALQHPPRHWCMGPPPAGLWGPADRGAYAPMPGGMLQVMGKPWGGQKVPTAGPHRGP